MRIPRFLLSRRFVVPLGVLFALCCCGALAFGPLVRARVDEAAARHGLEVTVGEVRPGWLAVNLVDVRARLKGVSGVSWRFAEVHVALTSRLAPHEVVAHGGEVVLHGTFEGVRDRLETWRAQRPAETPGTPSAQTRVRAEGLALLWDELDDGLVLQADGLAVQRDDAGLEVDAGVIELRSGKDSARATHASLALDRALVPTRVHAASLDLAWTPQPSEDESAIADAVVVPPPSHGYLAAIPDVSAMLKGVRERATKLATRVASRLPRGTRVDVDALRIERADATLGPGPFSLTRNADDLFVDLSTRTPAGGTSAPLTVRARLPIADPHRPVHVTLDGGPVALALLGLKDGTAGLTDLDTATLAGRADLVLDDASLAFDVDLAARGVSVFNRRLAHDTVRGLDAGVREKGALLPDGRLRLDESELSMGSIHLDTDGTLDVTRTGDVLADLHWTVRGESCQSMMQSIPQALVPAAYGTEWDGTFAAQGKVVLDTHRIDDLVLDYAFDDQCKVVRVPPLLDKARFTEPFPVRRYAPDGTPREDTSGPGTPGWTPIAAISRNMQVAVLMTEDGGMYRGGTFNHPQIKLAFVTDLKEKRFARGASTLLMQLAKNLFQSRDKTLARKLEQVILTEVLAQTINQREALELYLNVVEFGPNLYGVKAAAGDYYGKGPWGLSLAESLFLASMLPSPVKFHSIKGLGQVPDAWMASIRHLMEIAHASGLISQAQLDEGLTETIAFWGAPPPRPKPSDAGGTATQEKKVDSRLD
jgi:hypothetical protein